MNMLKAFIANGMFLLGAALLAPSAAQAVAGDESIEVFLNTSPLFADSGKSYHACNVANVTTSSVAIKVDILGPTGTTLVSSGATPFTLTAGNSYELANSAYTGFARCRVSVIAGSGGAVRANLSVFYYTGSYYQTLALSEAR